MMSLMCLVGHGYHIMDIRKNYNSCRFQELVIILIISYLPMRHSSPQVIQPDQQDPHQYFLTLNADLIQHNQRLSSLNTSHQIEQVRLREIIKQLQYGKSQNSVLTDYKNQHQQQLKTEETSLKQAKDKMQESMKQMREKHLNELKKEKARYEQLSRRKQGELGLLKKAQSQWRSKCLVMQMSSGQAKRQLNSLTKQTKTISDRLQSQQKKSQGRLTFVSHLEQEKQGLKLKLSQQLTELTTKHAQIQKLKGELSNNVVKVIEESKKKISDLERDRSLRDNQRNQFLRAIEENCSKTIDEISKLYNLNTTKELQDLKKIKKAKIGALTDAKQCFENLNKNCLALIRSCNGETMRLRQNELRSLEETNEKQRQIKNLASEIKKRDQAIVSKDNKIKQSQGTIQTLKKLLTEKDEDIKKKVNQILAKTGQLSEVRRSNQRIINQLKGEKAALARQNQQLRENLGDVKNQLSLATSKLKEGENKITSLDANLSQSTIKKRQVDALLADKMRQVEASTTLIKNLKTDIQNGKRRATKLEEEIEKMVREKSSLRDTIDNTERELIKAKQQGDILRKAKEDLHTIQHELVNEITHTFTGRAQIIDEAEVSRSIDNIKQQLVNAFREQKFFNNSDFVPRFNVSWLIDKLQDYTSRTVQTTKLIYKFDEQNKTNFHNYFDNKENLFSVIKLCNGTIIGGYTMHGFDSQRVQKPGKGFLFNLNRQKCYNIRQNPRVPVTTYDKFYFILGNAEIRIKSQEKKVFSNFGIALSTFESGTDNKRQFLNDETQNQVQIEGYQFYQVKFTGN